MRSRLETLPYLGSGRELYRTEFALQLQDRFLYTLVQCSIYAEAIIVLPYLDPALCRTVLTYIVRIIQCPYTKGILAVRRIVRSLCTFNLLYFSGLNALINH